MAATEILLGRGDSRIYPRQNAVGENQRVRASHDVRDQPAAKPEVCACGGSIGRVVKRNWIFRSDRVAADQENSGSVVGKPKKRADAKNA